MSGWVIAGIAVGGYLLFFRRGGGGGAGGADLPNGFGVGDTLDPTTGGPPRGPMPSGGGGASAAGGGVGGAVSFRPDLFPTLQPPPPGSSSQFAPRVNGTAVARPTVPAAAPLTVQTLNYSSAWGASAQSHGAIAAIRLSPGAPQLKIPGAP